MTILDRRQFISTIAAGAAFYAAPVFATYVGGAPMAPVFQLRIYEVAPDKRQQFHERFKNHALRIMKRYDFNPVAMWESTSVSNFEFIYILQWPDVKTMERQWAAFLADAEWIEIKRKMAADIGEPVQKVTGRVLENLSYFPAPVFGQRQASSSD